MTTIQRQRIAELRAELEKMDLELEAPLGAELSDAEVDDFIEQNREEIEASIIRGKAALARGELRPLTREGTPAFIRELIERGNRRRLGNI